MAQRIKGTIMPIIKFSHNYEKLKMHGMHGEILYPTVSVLLDVLNVNLETISAHFLDYDTDNGKYELPKSGPYLMLIFQKPDKNIFTTLRRFTTDKLLYYRSHIGHTFQVELTEKAE
jgi:hypothetical protein